MVWPSYEGPTDVFHACLSPLHAPYKGALLITISCVELQLCIEGRK